MENSSTQKTLFVDLEKVIASKNPSLPRLIPGFILRYLKKVIHQDDLNWVMDEFSDYNGVAFVNKIMDAFGVKVEAVGLEHIPTNRRVIIAANHPLGGLDGLALMKVVGAIRPDIVFPANDLLMNIPNLRSLFIPINKHGSNSQNLKIIDDAFASDKTVLYFPAGLCSRKTKGKIIDLEWKKTFVSKARKFERDVIPAYVEGRNSTFFYNLANVRKYLKIKTNIEMLYLVDEMFKQRGKVIRIHFGPPVPFTLFNREKPDVAWAAYMKDVVYRLGKGNGIP